MPLQLNIPIIEANFEKIRVAKSALIRLILFTVGFIVIGLNVQAQKGPGGVSVETTGPTQSTCRLWLDAGSLTALADGDNVTSWQDISLSAVSEIATAGVVATPPYFRDDPAFSINNYPVITFEDGRYFKMLTSSDLNTDGITYTKTVLLAFRTSDDVTSSQVLYEEGGTERGFNIIIENGNLIIGSYDIRHTDNDQPSGSGDTPAWGYSYIQYPIEPNTTQILSAQFFVANWGVVANNANYFLLGSLNGNIFNTMVLGPTHNAYFSADPDINNGIGTLAAHSDPIGIGAMNSDMIDRNQIWNNTTGTKAFKGQFAELCYYKDFLNESKRIIVENYLGAKYLADLVANDKYAHQLNYGHEVIGIGQQTNDVLNRHNLSRGRNPFTIQVNDIANFNNDNQFFLTGHDGGNLIYSTSNVPNNSESITRLERIWRAERTGPTLGNIKYTIDASAIPPQPAGYNTLVMLVDASSANFPNFSLPTTQVREMQHISGNIYELSSPITDNDFYTFGWARLEVNFTRNTCYTIETDAVANTNVGAAGTSQVTLNYLPQPGSGSTKIDYQIVPVSAVRTDDYDYSDAAQALGLTINAGQQTANLPVQRVNDDIEESPSVELFKIILENGINTTAGITIGPRDTLDFYIYDDDPLPEVSFASPTSEVIEPAGTSVNHNVVIVRSGDVSGTATVTVEVEYPLTTARDVAALPDPDDFNFSGPYTVTFDPGQTSRNVPISILGDEVYEHSEFITIRITNAVGAGFPETSIIEHQIEIQDNDPYPVASFASATQSGFETSGSPVITVTLDRYSAVDVLVDFEINIALSGPGYATYNVDYTGAPNGIIEFPPFAVEGYLGPLNIVSAIPGEDDELIEFTLTGGTDVTIGASPTFIPTATYTIIDYSPFENRGVAGIGKAIDNILWIDPDRMSGTGLQPNLPNYTPHAIAITRNGDDNNSASLDVLPALNNRKVLYFDGLGNGTGAGDMYTIANSPRINIAGFSERLSYFFVMRPEQVPNTPIASLTTAPSNATCRVIYEQGGNQRGTSIYMYMGKLYFAAYNDGNTDGDQAPWGYDNDQVGNAAKVASSVYVESAQTILPNVNYVVSCHFDNNSNEPLMMYVNGVKGIMSTTITADPANSVGKLYGHTGPIGLGAINTELRLHFTTSKGALRLSTFRGHLGEFLIYHEHELNETRRVILENYLSAKFNIPLDNSDTPQVFDLTYADNTTSTQQDFYTEIAGVGKLNVNTGHGDAQGPSSVLRVKDPTIASTGYLMWGSNGRTLTNTYPWSYHNGLLPTGIEERSGQVWKIFESPANSVANADFYINFGSSANAAQFNLNSNLLKLITHSNADPDDFSGGNVYNLSSFGSGNIARFENIPTTDGMYVALGNTSPINITPLPIELLFFKAQLIEDRVLLNWATQSEIDNERFIIERAGSDLVWKPILEQLGAGHSTARLDYNDVDLSPLSGISYYRLKQIDFDGAFEYSDVVSIINNSNGKIDAAFAYPNPTNLERIFIQLPMNVQDNEVFFDLTDISGKIINKFYFEKAPAIVDLELGSLHSGIYLIHYRSISKTESLKIIVQ